MELKRKSMCYRCFSILDNKNKCPNKCTEDPHYEFDKIYSNLLTIDNETIKEKPMLYGISLIVSYDLNKNLNCLNITKREGIDLKQYFRFISGGKNLEYSFVYHNPKIRDDKLKSIFSLFMKDCIV